MNRYKPTSLGPFSETYGRPLKAGGQGNDIIDSFVLETSSAGRSKGQGPSTLYDFSTTFRLRLGRATKGSDTRVRYGGIRVRCAILAEVLCTAYTLECASDTDMSKPANHRYCVLQSRCNVPSVYHQLTVLLRTPVTSRFPRSRLVVCFRLAPSI